MKYLEAGKIVNTHGIRGEVRILPWTDTPAFLVGFELLYIDGEPVKVMSSRVHKNCVIAALDGVSDINAAIRLKNKTVCIDKADAQLEEGRYFIADLLGLRVIDSETGAGLGVVSDVLTLPSNDVYVVTGDREILIPAVPEFIIETSTGEGYIKVRLIEGM